MGFADLLAAADDAALQHLGDAVSYTPEGGEAVEVSGIFDAAYVLVDGGGPGVSSCSPAVFVRLEDLPSDPREDEPRITVAGVTYRVKEVKPDGQASAAGVVPQEGGILLLLSEV